VVIVKYGDMQYYCEGAYDDVCKAIVDGKALDVFYHGSDGTRLNYRITFFQDVDWVALEL
jgi:hypothetical protein